MRTRIAIAALIYMLVQGVLFGIGVIAILASPLVSSAQTLIPWMIVATIPISVPIAWMIAPRLRARFGRTHPAVSPR
ncbi:MAG TPA: hypothetical protein VHN39_03525 [Phenylobacterium sp.]|jgi:hypothetical protein|nr:hypothetical protein [Phenylobacterium sp.]